MPDIKFRVRDTDGDPLGVDVLAQESGGVLAEGVLENLVLLDGALQLETDPEQDFTLAREGSVPLVNSRHSMTYDGTTVYVKMRCDAVLEAVKYIAHSSGTYSFAIKSEDGQTTYVTDSVESPGDQAEITFDGFSPLSLDDDEVYQFEVTYASARTRYYNALIFGGATWECAQQTLVHGLGERDLIPGMDLVFEPGTAVPSGTTSIGYIDGQHTYSYPGVGLKIRLTDVGFVIDGVGYMTPSAGAHSFRLMNQNETVVYRTASSEASEPETEVTFSFPSIYLEPGVIYTFEFTYPEGRTLFYDGMLKHTLWEYAAQTKVHTLGNRSLSPGMSMYFGSGVYSEGSRVSPEIALHGDGDTDEVYIEWGVEEPTGTGFVVETAVTDGDPPDEQDWVEQVNESQITNIPSGSLEGKVLWIRQLFEADESNALSPMLFFVEVYRMAGDAVADIRVSFAGSTLRTNLDGEAVFKALPEKIFFDCEVEVNVLDPVKDFVTDIPVRTFGVGRNDDTIEVEVPVKKQYFTDFAEPQTPVDMVLEIDETDSIEYPAGFRLMSIQDAWRDGYWSIEEFGEELVFSHSQTAGLRRSFLLWHKPGCFVDVLVTAQFLVPNGEGKRPGIVLRGSNSGDNGTGYLCKADEDNGELVIERLIDGSSVVLATDGYVFDNDVWYNIKAEVAGTTVRMKVWKDGESEPAEWDLSLTDELIDAGYVGYYDETTGTSYFRDLRVQGTPASPVGWYPIWDMRASQMVPVVVDYAGLSGDKALDVYYVDGSNQRSCLVWAVPDCADVVEIRTRVKTGLVATGSHFVRMQASMAADGLETANLVRCAGTSGGLEIGTYYRGDFTARSSISSTALPFHANEWLNIRFKYDRNEGRLYLKGWKDADPEPEEWQLDITHTNDLRRAFVGIGSLTNSGYSTVYDFFGVGINGAPAPEEAI